MFWLVATPVLWIIVVAPLTILFSWWTQTDTSNAITWSFLAAPLISLWIFFSFRTANLLVKWPATQLIGITTLLMNVVAVCSALLFIFPKSTVAFIATALWVALACHAIAAAHRIHNTSLNIASNKINRPYRLIHLSDIHAGSRRAEFVDKVVKQTMKHQPDIVLITGDLLDSSAVNTQYLAPLSQLTCPVMLCLGNHERYVNLQKAIDSIEANNVRVLRNEAITLGDIEVIGIDDADSANEVATQLPSIKRSDSKFQILMYHRPQGFEVAASSGIDLMLSGHTHAGQVWPFGVLVKRQFPRMKGEFRIGDSTLYVSQGTGTWGPIMRLGTISEMTLIELTSSRVELPKTQADL